jgi:acid stress-induced BolA-like protein IbaG/YrbA
MHPQEVAKLIQEGMDTIEVEVRSDDGSHFSALDLSEQFAGLRPLQRHQLVYGTLGERVGREIHALSIRALTAAERDSAAE